MSYSIRPVRTLNTENTMQTSEYAKQATDFLTAHNLEFRAVLIGSDCPMFCEDAQANRDMDKVEVFPRKSHIHGKHYRCTFSRKDKGHLTVDFWNSYADEEFNALGSKRYQHGEEIFKGKKRLPTAYDVLTAITKNEPGTFENFAADYGYDEDSRKAEQVYNAVVKEWTRVRRFFTDEELEQLQEIQ